MPIAIQRSVVFEEWRSHKFDEYHRKWESASKTGKWCDNESKWPFNKKIKRIRGQI